MRTKRAEPLYAMQSRSRRTRLVTVERVSRAWRAQATAGFWWRFKCNREADIIIPTNASAVECGRLRRTNRPSLSTTVLPRLNLNQSVVYQPPIDKGQGEAIAEVQRLRAVDNGGGSVGRSAWGAIG